MSFFNGLTTLSENIRFLDDDVFALVDANRPLVPASQFVDLYNLATVHGCSCPARPLVNGVASIENNQITCTKKG